MKSETTSVGKPHLRSWAAECQGFEVHGPDGLIGWLEGVALLVRADGDRELVSVPVADVRAVVPECHQLLID